jgi:hypothetical protein
MCCDNCCHCRPRWTLLLSYALQHCVRDHKVWQRVAMPHLPAGTGSGEKLTNPFALHAHQWHHVCCVPRAAQAFLAWLMDTIARHPRNALVVRTVLQALLDLAGRESLQGNLWVRSPVGTPLLLCCCRWAPPVIIATPPSESPLASPPLPSPPLAPLYPVTHSCVPSHLVPSPGPIVSCACRGDSTAGVLLQARSCLAHCA